MARLLPIFVGMCYRWPFLPSASHIAVVLALLIVASTPRSAPAQAPEGAAVATVRHTLSAEVGAVMQARWRPFTRAAIGDAGKAGQRWSTSGRVHSNVPVIAVIALEDATRLIGWQLRDATGHLVPWNGRETAVSLPLGPGASDVAVHLVAPTGAEELLRLVQLRVVAAPRR